jgi:hypothetical protein
VLSLCLVTCSSAHGHRVRLISLRIYYKSKLYVHATALSVKGHLCQAKYERYEETCCLDTFVRLMTQDTVKVNAVCACVINKNTSKDEENFINNITLYSSSGTERTDMSLFQLQRS